MLPNKVGTRQFVEELTKRHFSRAEDVLMAVTGKQLTLPYLNQSGFNRYLVHQQNPQ